MSRVRELYISDHRLKLIHPYPPEGFKPVRGAMTAPVGTQWYSNNKSLFTGERVSVLVRND